MTHAVRFVAVAVLVALVLCVPVEAQTPEIDDLWVRAEQGVATAQASLGFNYSLGFDVPEDDAFVDHGVQLLRGIEIYNGKPIFYGLGEFFREAQWTLSEQLGQTDANQQSPRQNFARSFGGSTQSLESLVAVSHYADGELAEVRLYPTELGADEPDSRLGIPRLAQPDKTHEALERMQRLSRDFGTTIDIQGNVGVIRIK